MSDDLPQESQLLIYQAKSGAIDVRFENETVWLTQQHMADLFQTTKQNVGQHIKNIFEEGELTEKSVVKNFFTTAADGKNYSTNFYNLDAIISVGYRVKSRVATQFRIWATQRLRDVLVFKRWPADAGNRLYRRGDTLVAWPDQRGDRSAASPPPPVLKTAQMQIRGTDPGTGSRLLRMPRAVKENELPRPQAIRLLGAPAVVGRSRKNSHLIEQFGLGRGHVLLESKSDP